MKKALPYILYSLVIAVAAGLLIYQGVIAKELTGSNLTKGLLIIAAALLGMFRPRHRNKVSNKKVVYQKAFPEYVTGAFSEEPKLEKKLYNAIDDFNFDRYAAGIKKLEDLRKECQSTADVYAVTVFTALCYDGMAAYEDAVKHYTDAFRIRRNSTLLSNAGMCCMRMGKLEDAQNFYQQAIDCDDKNAFPWNNLAAMYFKEGEYEGALEYAEGALQRDPKMPQALSCAAICCALLGETEDYERYYRQAVANGYDGNKIKAAIKALDTAY